MKAENMTWIGSASGRYLPSIINRGRAASWKALKEKSEAVLLFSFLCLCLDQFGSFVQAFRSHLCRHKLLFTRPEGSSKRKDVKPAAEKPNGTAGKDETSLPEPEQNRAATLPVEAAAPGTSRNGKEDEDSADAPFKTVEVEKEADPNSVDKQASVDSANMPENPDLPRLEGEASGNAPLDLTTDPKANPNPGYINSIEDFSATAEEGLPLPAGQGHSNAKGFPNGDMEGQLESKLKEALQGRHLDLNSQDDADASAWYCVVPLSSAEPASFQACLLFP